MGRKAKYDRDGIDWDKVGLGEKTDTELSDELGVPLSTVFYARKTRGIPRYSRWDGVDLSGSPTALARQYGVSKQMIHQARRSQECRGTVPEAQPVVVSPEVRALETWLLSLAGLSEDHFIGIDFSK